MAKYSRALDLVTSSIRMAQKGKMPEAAKLFEAALKSKDLDATLATLETQQVAAFNEVQKANPTLASLFTEIAAKAKPKKKSKAKAKPFGGKAAPPFKKKVKAAEGEDEGEEESGIDDELDPVLDEMTADDLTGDDGLNVVDGDDLSLEDLDELLDTDGIEEMPEANVTAGEGEDEGEEESADDSEEKKDDAEEESSDDSEDDEGEEESAPAQTAKVKVVASNLAALDRLRKSKTQAGTKKPAK
jgi:hypothetical protein